MYKLQPTRSSYNSIWATITATTVTMEAVCYSPALKDTAPSSTGDKKNCNSKSISKNN